MNSGKVSLIKRFLNVFYIVLTNLFIITLLVILIEVILHFKNFKPLAYYLPIETANKLIETKTDSVHLLPFIYPDSLGLLKVDLTRYDSSHTKYNDSWSDELFAYLKDENYNEEGFRCRSFKQIPSNKTVVAFIGDSYVFGYEAQPLSNSFVDIIQRKDSQLCCLNLGIAGTDLAGYKALAKYYIPKLKPNIVVCCIYANDFVYYKKNIESYTVNDVFLTYEGVLLKENINYSGNKVQVFKTPNDAYYDLKSKEDFFKSFNNNRISRFLFNHSRIYSTLKRGNLKSDNDKIKFDIYDRINTSPEYLKDISMICKRNNSKLLVFLIPDYYKENSLTEKELFTYNLKTNLYLYYPENLDSSCYVGFHQHFNNKGYQLFADFVYSTLDTISLDVK